MIITHNMKVCLTQRLATYPQGQGHNFYSNMVKKCYSQNFVLGPHLLQRRILIITANMKVCHA